MQAGSAYRASIQDNEVRRGFAFLLLAIVVGTVPPAEGQGGTLSPCTLHSDCRAESESSFCAVETCESVDGLKWLCGECRPCSQCLCHSLSFTGSCPDECGSVSDVLSDIQGVFHHRDADNIDACVDVWEFDFPMFSRFRVPAALLEAEALGDARVAAECANEPAGWRYGSFEVDHSTSPPLLLLMYTDESAASSGTLVPALIRSACGDLDLLWARDTGSVGGERYEPSGGQALLRRVGASSQSGTTPPAGRWEGQLNIMESICRAVLDVAPADPARWLMRWEMHVFNCSVDPGKLAPQLRGAEHGGAPRGLAGARGRALLSHEMQRLAGADFFWNSSSLECFDSDERLCHTMASCHGLRNVTHQVRHVGAVSRVCGSDLRPRRLGCAGAC
jgi:hypothetical protein